MFIPNVLVAKLQHNLSAAIVASVMSLNYVQPLKELFAHSSIAGKLSAGINSENAL